MISTITKALTDSANSKRASHFFAESKTGRSMAYIVPDPQHEYAISLMHFIKKTYGFVPIFIYSNSRDALYRRHAYPEVEAMLPAAVFYLDRTPMASTSG